MAIADQPLVEQDEQQPDQSAQTEQQEPDESRDPLEGREDLQKALYRLYQGICLEERWARMMEVKDVQQAHLYWRSLQYWWWSQSEERWNLPNQNRGLSMGPVDEMPRFEFVTNIYQAFGLSLIAAIAQRPPRTKWFPEDAEEPEDVETAEGSEKLTRIIEKWNPVHVQMQDEVFHLWTGGLVVAWVGYMADDKLGVDEVEELAEEQVETGEEVHCAKCGFTAPVGQVQVPRNCPNCGAPLTEENVAPGQSGAVPVSAGKTDVPKGRETIRLYGALNFKRTMTARTQAEYLYCAIEEEIHYAKIRAAYPDKADEIKPGEGGGDENSFERYARLGVMQGGQWSPQSVEGSGTLNTFSRVWFRPEAFYHDSVKKHRDELLKLFPSGCRVFFSGEVYCESADECMDDVIKSEHAIPGDGQHRPAIGTTLISVQDRFNTLSNIQVETYEYGIPVTYRDAGMFDEEADAEQVSEPGATVDVNVGAGDIRAKIMQIRADSVSPDMAQHAADLMGPVAQFLTGGFPALLGAGAAQGAAGDTAAGYKMQMDQALGRCGISYVRLKQFHADVQTLACKDFREHAQGKVGHAVVGPSGDFENESVDITTLKGSARAYPEGDENYPELWSLQRAALFELMQSPFAPMLMQSPSNQDLAVRLVGIPDLEAPGADMKRYGMRVIGQLSAAPTMPPEAIQGLIRKLEDHGALAGIAKHWLFSEAGLKCMKDEPDGYANVEAWAAIQASLVPTPPPQEKPLSKTLTAAIDKLPPEAQAQILSKEYGIELSPEDFIVQTLMDKLKKPTPKPPQATPGLPPRGGNPVAGA